MPKDPWRSKPRRRRGRGKIQQGNRFERPQLPVPPEPSIIIDTISDMPPVKSEEPEEYLHYPDTRFPQSTTLFPASGVQNNSRQPESLNETYKRVAEDNLLFKIPKKVKLTDSTTGEETFSDDCMIIENSPEKVKVAVSTKTTEETFCDDCIIIEESPKKVEVQVIDLTDESKPIVPIACTPVKTSFLKLRKPNFAHKANGEARVKVESDEKTCETYTIADTNQTIQEKSKENKASRHADTTTHNIFLTSELDIENGNDRGINSQVRVTNTVSVSLVKNPTDARISDNHIFNDIPIILDQNKNYEASDNSAFTSDVNPMGINFVYCPGNSEQNKTKRNYEVGENYMTTPTSSFKHRTEIPSKIPLVAENLSQSVLKQPTKEKVQDWLESCSGNSGKAQENVVCDKDERGADSSHSVILPVAQVKKESEDMDCQEISFNSDGTQPNEDLSQKNTSMGRISTETLTSNELNRVTTSPINHSGIFPGVSQLNEQEKFCKKFLKYLNVNTKVDLPEISNAILYLNNMIMGKETAVGGNRMRGRSETSKNLPMEEQTSSNLPMEKGISSNLPIKKEISNNLPMEKGISSNLSIKKEISNNLPMEKSNILELLSSDVLRQILNTTNTAKPI